MLESATETCHHVAMNGHEFKQIRAKLGVTQERLARMMDITVRHVIRLEQSEIVPLKYAHAIHWLEHLSDCERA